MGESWQLVDEEMRSRGSKSLSKGIQVVKTFRFPASLPCSAMLLLSDGSVRLSRDSSVMWYRVDKHNAW